LLGCTWRPRRAVRIALLPRRLGEKFHASSSALTRRIRELVVECERRGPSGPLSSLGTGTAVRCPALCSRKIELFSYKPHGRNLAKAEGLLSGARTQFRTFIRTMNGKDQLVTVKALGLAGWQKRRWSWHTPPTHSTSAIPRKKLTRWHSAARVGATKIMHAAEMIRNVDLGRYLPRAPLALVAIGRFPDCLCQIDDAQSPSPF
jgi:hypothetical protein